MMCTTASVCMCIAVMTGKLHSSFFERDEDITCMVNSIINIASKAHNIMEAQIHRRKGAKGFVAASMVSSSEVFGLLGINCEMMGIKLLDLISCSLGECTSLLPNNNFKGSLLYEASSCFILPSHIPECLLIKPRGVGEFTKRMVSTTTLEARGSTCVLTSGGHSTCAMYSDSESSYSTFDPLTGLLKIGMSRSQFVHEITNIWGISTDNQCDITIIH